jgi:hypothetical protein
MAKKKAAKSAKKSVKSAKKSTKKRASAARQATGANRLLKRSSSSPALKSLEKFIAKLSDEEIGDLVTLGSIITARSGPCMRIPRPNRLADNKWEITTEELGTLSDVTAERAEHCMRIPRPRRRPPA